MKFTCDRCSAQYMISDEKVGPSGVKVRCKKCGNVIVVRRAADVPAEPAVAPAAPTPPAGGLDAELGSAFDHAFGEPPAAAAGAESGAPATEGAAAQATEGAGTSAPSAPPTTEWYVAIGQAQVGPLPLTEVKRKWEAGDVGPDSLVWRPGMGDWQPLSTQTELASYLAPVPRGSAAPSRAEAPLHRSTPQPMPAAAPAEPAAEVEWKPVGASALAALASEEIAARGAPEPKPEPTAPAAGVKSLVEGLPDGGGVDPTGAVPLSIKGLEITDEKKLERRSTIASRAEETRHKRSVVRVALGAAVLVVAAGGGAAAWFFTQGQSAPKVAIAPPPPAAPVAPAPAPAPAAPAAAPAPVPPPAAAPSPPPPAVPAVAAAPAQAAPPPAPAPQPAAPQGKHGARKTRPEPVAKAKPAGKPARVAAAPAPEAAPPAAPARKKKDALLDFDSSDSALDEALGGGDSKRSVYVPPALTGAPAVPDKLSAAQINEAVAGRIDSLRRCVSEQKARDPGAAGVLKLKWVIGGDGAVRNVKPLPGAYASGPFAGCITGVVKGIRFPRSATAGQEVTFPFSF